MTRRYCDLCDKPAMERLPNLAVEFPDKTWRGIKPDPGSIACVDGNWTPRITAHVLFEFHNDERQKTPHAPDLCSLCMADLLRRMSVSLLPPKV